MTWEEWHAFINAHLSAPVVEETAEDGATWFTSGDPGEVMVRLKGTSIAVFEYSVERQARRAVVMPLRVGSLRSRGLDDTRAMGIVSALIDATRERRTARFQTCGGEHRGAVH
jgi:hypothetical protein